MRKRRLFQGLYLSGTILFAVAQASCEPLVPQGASGAYPSAADLPAPVFNPAYPVFLEGFTQQDGWLICHAGAEVVFNTGAAEFAWIAKGGSGGNNERVIAGQTEQALPLTEQEVGSSIACRVTVSNAAGSASAVSAFVGPVLPADNGKHLAANIAPPSLTPRPIQAGSSSRCSVGVWDRYSQCQNLESRWLRRSAPDAKPNVFGKFGDLMGVPAKKYLGSYLSCQVRVRDDCNGQKSEWVESPLEGPVSRPTAFAVSEIQAECTGASCTVRIRPDRQEYIGFHALFSSKAGGGVTELWSLTAADGMVPFVLSVPKLGRYELQIRAIMPDLTSTTERLVHLKKTRDGLIAR